MLDMIVHLDADVTDGSARIGHKAATLNQLTRVGFPVPAGICITTDAFRAAVAPVADRVHSLRATHDLRDPAVARDVARDIGALLDGVQLPAGLLHALAQALPALGNGTLAVRSSAAVEDLPSASFAGQYRSVLGVRADDVHALADAILTVWRSFFSPHAIAARALHADRGVTAAVASDPGMAVLIQPLIDAECAGVCFSVDPVRAHAGLLLVTATWGLGAGVVDGTAPVDTVRLRRLDWGVEEAIISDKHTCIRPDIGGGVRPVAVPDVQRRLACLPESWLQRVAQFGLAAEQHLGQPQDVEWAIADQRIWLLQSRPITTLPEDVRRAAHFPIEWASEQERTRTWWLERINSRLSAALLPAELEYVNTSTAGGQAAVRYGGGARTRWRKVVNGRVYMAVAASGVSPGDGRIRHAALTDLFDRLEQQAVTMWEHWGPEIVRATGRLGTFDGRSADGNALADHLEDTLAAAERHWMIHTLMPRPGLHEPLLALYEQLTGRQRDEAELDMPFLLQGAETVQTRLVEALYDLACLALAQPGLAEWIQTRPARRYARLRDLPGAEPFVQRFEQLMAVYGGRVNLFTCGVDGESPVELPLPWREAPEHVLDMITLYLPLAAQGDGASPRAWRERARREQRARVDAVCAAARDPALANSFRQSVDYFQRNAAFLDEHNHYIDQLAEGQYTQALIHAGRWLAGRGDLAHVYDIFWLRPSEVLSALRAQGAQVFGAVIADRKAEFDAWRDMQAPAYIGLPDAQMPDRPASEPVSTAAHKTLDSPGTLTGQAASSGRRSGRARIMVEPGSLPDVVAGDVLVAVNAGPVWTPVFPILAGIVLDSGSPGDHSAITAREFGVPAVFGAAHATRRIPPGARVTVDGDTGTVTWEYDHR